MGRLGIPGLSLAVAEDGALVYEAAFGFADVENGVPRAARDGVPAGLGLEADDGRGGAAARGAGPAGSRRPRLALLPGLPREALARDGPAAALPPGRSPALPAGRADVHAALRVLRRGARRCSATTRSSTSRGRRCATRPTATTCSGAPRAGAAGTSFLSLLAEAVFGPAGMTSDRSRRRAGDHAASGPGLRPGRGGPAPELGLADMSYKVPGGGLSGTAADVARFGSALVSGRLCRRPRSTRC